MNFRNYLNERRTTKVVEHFVRNFVEKYCQDAFNGTPMFRGVRSYTQDYYYVEASESTPRISPYSDHNFYNLLFSNLPSWKQYPPRDKSIVGTTDFDRAGNRQQGTPYLIIPKDGTKIGVCPEYDIWFSFSNNMSGTLDHFNDVLTDFFYENNVSSTKIETDYNSFKKACMKIDKLKETGRLILYNGGWLGDDLLYEFAQQGSGFLEFLNRKLDPERNDFGLAKSGDYIGDDNEVWTDGQCILVCMESDYGKEIMKNDRFKLL
jgi:hypothetical protein